MIPLKYDSIQVLTFQSLQALFFNISNFLENLDEGDGLHRWSKKKEI